MIIILYDGLHIYDDHHSVRPLILTSTMSICNHVNDNRHERYKGYAIWSQSISYMIGGRSHDQGTWLSWQQHIFIILTCSPDRFFDPLESWFMMIKWWPFIRSCRWSHNRVVYGGLLSSRLSLLWGCSTAPPMWTNLMTLKIHFSAKWFEDCSYLLKALNSFKTTVNSIF